MHYPLWLARITVLLNVILAALFIYQLNKSSHINEATQAQIQTLSTKKIAILAPAVMPVIERIEKGFIEEMNKNPKVHYEFRSFNSGGNKSLMLSQVEEILASSYDLIFSIGISATQMAKEVTTKKNIFIPIVFCAIDDAVKYNIVASEASSGNHVTGASALKVTSYSQGLSLLFALKPSIKTLLLPYNPTTLVGHNDINQLDELCKQHNVTIQKIEIFNVNEITSKLNAFITQGDALFVIRDSTVMGGIDAVIKLCNLHGVTVFASDIESTQKGAALGLGLDETESGAHAATKVKLILEDNKKPSDIPITIPNYRYTLHINEEAMKTQGLTISEEMMFLIKNTEVIAS